MIRSLSPYKQCDNFYSGYHLVTLPSLSDIHLQVTLFPAGGAGGSAAEVQPREAEDLGAEAARVVPGGPAAGARPRVPLPPR